MLIQHYNPVEAYNGEIRYSISPGGAVVRVEYDGQSYSIDYTSEIESAVNYWRRIIPNIYPGLTIRHTNQGESNFVIGYSSNMNLFGSRQDREPAISYIPNSEHANSEAMRNHTSDNAVVSHGIYIDNFLVGMNDDRIRMISTIFGDVHNTGDIIKRYMYILLVRHLGYALGFAPDDTNVHIGGNTIAWYSPEISFISRNDSLTPRLMQHYNTFDYIEELLRLINEEEDFNINNVVISPQEEIVARICLGGGAMIEQSEEMKEFYQMCNPRKITFPLTAQMMTILNTKRITSNTSDN
ncbi:hypothetical protein Xbed_01850 [Xenorhabdus beddingii]|uniref:Uncharacterized protein n=1 Tax=Xenorhabdus beddingii TaxID=40578 RepID=A0A1Y2SP23_9GAMM|nr:hypothetical protein Xbed_01850 [Xenorhabdus beddingii]